ncbi:SusC/RagA family TonB-linked outer membrane protein [Hymenobacter lucidus]|uniref:SusC/RagA family TonB-linked outer membrane protein n=1 Tax=Hymenobacter lucidus TaxID=2880930 RepID=A0ABS8AVM7_9BACT|nr:SusC/RagA family TonB-linked outer membrane protein [Hymenobacter lucidus]MCB2409591.1 SusC/RagA family TonB-linked outer membrane protein [Hymenobacter lucidus]
MKKILFVSFLLMLTLLQQVTAQNRSVSGRVTDRQTGEGIPGVTVLLKGTSNGISTNADGTYTLSVPADGGTLTFSSIGFVSIERPIGTESQINIGLVVDSKQLSEVVVTALGIERERKSLGYAVQTLENKEITRASESNLVRSLQGRVAGVQITGASGSAGGATRVVIRGAQSFTGDNQPIYVVDGIVISNSAVNSSTGSGGDLNNGVDLPNRAGDIDPNNVESITVLKGPAAAALYGARAASGAIIITTKQGKGTKGSQISVNSSVTFDRVNRLPNFQNTYGSGSDGEYFADNNVSWGPKIMGQNVADWHTIGLRLNANEPADSIKLEARPNNVRDFFETGKTFNNSVSFAGSNEASNYYISLSDVRTSSIVPNTNYKRTSVALSGGTRLFNRLTTNGTVTYVKSGGDRGIQGQSRANIIQTIVNTPRDFEITDQKNFNDPRYNLTGYYLNGFRNNPYFLLENNLLTDNVDRVLGAGTLSYDPLSWLNITLRQGVDFYSDRRRQTIAQGTINNLAGRYIEDVLYGRNATTDLLVNVTKEINENFTIKGVLGGNYQQQAFERNNMDANGLVIGGFYDLSNSAAPVVVAKTETLTRLMGAYADVQLSFRDYLFLGLTGRNDWSSTLPKANRSFFYPSANVGFVFTEAFKLPSDVITFGKLRANIASVGKSAPPYSILPVFTKSSVDGGFSDQYLFPFNNTIPGFRVGNTLGNPNLKSELTTAYEVGTEVRFLKNRIGLDFTYYNSVSKDIIVAVPVSTTSGFTSQFNNAGSMENKGIEVALNLRPIELKNGFTWDVNMTYTRNRNEVTAVTGNTPNIGLGGLSAPSLEARVGQPYQSFFGSKMLRDPEGRVVVSPTTGFPLADPKLTSLGSIQPDYLAGLSTTLAYKGLALNVLFDTKQGGKFYSQTITTGYFAGTLEETTANDRQPFIYPNSVLRNADGTFTPNTTVKADGGYAYWSQVSNINENSLFDASFVKFREASLSYSLPANLVSKAKLTGIQFSLIGRNLAIWTPKSQKHMDPEVSSFGSGNSQGYEFFAYPSTRSFGASLKLTL